MIRMFDNIVDENVCSVLTWKNGVQQVFSMPSSIFEILPYSDNEKR